MPTILGQMFFSSQCGTRLGGWTEGHYLIGVPALPDAITRLIELATARSKLCGANVAMPYLRVSDVDVYRDSQVAGGPPGLRPVSPRLPMPPLRAPIDSTGSNATGGGSQTAQDWIFDNGLRPEAEASGNVSDLRCDMPWSGVLLRAEAGPPFTARRSILLRGLPDYVIQSATDLPGAGRWADNLAAFILILRSGTWGFRANDTSAANPPMPISNIDTTTTTPVFTCTPIPPAGGGAAPAAPTVGQTVRVGGTKLIDSDSFFHSLNGTYTVVGVPSPGQFVCKDLRAPKNLVILQKGTVRVRRPLVVPYAKIIGRRWGKRPVGVPFDPFHGRAKTRASQFA